MHKLRDALEANLEMIRVDHQVEPLSREFIFGGNEKNANLRNQLFALTPDGRMTLLSAILRLGFSDSVRSKLFPSRLHLGSKKALPTENLTIVELARTLRLEKERNLPKGGRPQRPHTRESFKKDFETITTALSQMTGKTFGKYKDRQNALRVLYLFARMMPHSGFPEERSKRLLTLIKTPSKRFSFELRDAHPIEESAANTYLLSDLKEYLAIEIDPNKRDLISSTFGSLVDCINDLRVDLERSAYSSGQPSKIVQAFKSILTVEATLSPTASNGGSAHARLDEDLYLHLHRVEFLHFAGALGEALELAKPSSPISPIRTEIIEAMSSLFNEPKTYFDTTREAFALEAMPNFVKRHEALFLSLISKALGFMPSEADFDRSISLACELLYRCRVFARGLSPRESVLVTFRSLVSALCATTQAIKFPTHYRPRVFGNNTQARSIVTTLEVPMVFGNQEEPKALGESYQQLWLYRREWVQDLLEGNQDIANVKFALRRLLLTRFSDCVQANDITPVIEDIAGLVGRLQSLGTHGHRP